MILNTDFRPLLNQTFKIVFSDLDYVMTLTEVSDQGKPFKAGARQPFSLMFDADATVGVLRQGLYPVEHKILGKRPIFLIPRAVDGNRCVYEAVYN